MWKDRTLQPYLGCLSLTAIFFAIIAYGSAGLLFAFGRLPFVEHVFGRARDQICMSYNTFDQTYATKYRYMPELQPVEYTIDSMRNMTWDDKLLTPIGGFLRVEMEDGSVVGSSVSMFHHLHCLIMVRDMLTGRQMDEEFEQGGELHWAHCLDYMANVGALKSLIGTTFTNSLSRLYFVMLMTLWSPVGFSKTLNRSMKVVSMVLLILINAVTRPDFLRRFWPRRRSLSRYPTWVEVGCSRKTNDGVLYLMVHPPFILFSMDLAIKTFGSGCMRILYVASLADTRGSYRISLKTLSSCEFLNIIGLLACIITPKIISCYSPRIMMVVVPFSLLQRESTYDSKSRDSSTEL
jgi:hypothetical protein